MHFNFNIVKTLYVIIIFSFHTSLSLALPEASDRNTLNINNDSTPTQMGEYVDIIQDIEGKLTFFDINETQNSEWFTSPLGTPNFSYTDSVYWFKGHIRNIDIHELNGLIEIGNPLLSDIEYYFVIDDKVEQYFISGSKHPFENRSLPHRNFLFPFALEENEIGSFYLRVNSKSSLQVPISISPTYKFFEYDQLELSGKSAYYGMMFIIILYNLFLFFSLREPVYIFYILFITGFALQQLSIHGFMTANVFPSNPAIQEYTVLFFMPFTLLFATLFTQHFLSLWKTAPNINKLFHAYAILCVLMMIGVFLLDYSSVGKMVAAAAVVVSFTCVLLGPYLWLKGFTIARFYSVAWICVAAGSATLALNKLGIIPRTALTENGLLFGSAAEAILLSLALADRLNIERRHRLVAQKNVISETENRIKAEDKLVYTALHHHVTGMPNRVFFEAWFNNLDKEKKRHSIAFGLIHLSRFHEINQTLGHSLADGLFNKIAKIINNEISNKKSVIELENENQEQHYVTIIEGVYIGFAMDLSAGEDPNLTISSLLNNLNQPIDYQEMLIDLGASGGWAIFDNDVDSAATLIRNSLIAIDIGHSNNTQITQYTHVINPYSPRRLTLVGELRKALETDGLELYYQPQLSVKENKATSMEALLRWFHPEHGFIPPDEFILIAEQSGIINPLTEWVLNEALGKIAHLNSLGIKQQVAINISAVNLRDTQFPNLILSLLHKHNVDSSQLVLEVTETAMMHDPELALSILNDISNLGVKLSIDDFGTGHSSLSYIKRLPVQEIKIDRSFVMSMQQSKDDHIIVNTTINMCHDLGLEVVAEGVETMDIQDELIKMKCDYIQGYGLSHPLPYEKLLAWLQDRNKS